MLSLLIMAENPLARVGLSALLTEQTQVTVTGQSSGQALADDLDLFKPDVVICDWGWGGGLDRLVAARELGVPVVALVEDATGAGEAWSAGEVRPGQPGRVACSPVRPMPRRLPQQRQRRPMASRSCIRNTSIRWRW